MPCIDYNIGDENAVCCSCIWHKKGFFYSNHEWGCPSLSKRNTLHTQSPSSINHSRRSHVVLFAYLPTALCVHARPARPAWTNKEYSQTDFLTHVTWVSRSFNRGNVIGGAEGGETHPTAKGCSYMAVGKTHCEILYRKSQTVHLR